MPALIPSASPGGDMFIKIEGARSGPIKGESQDPAHLDEIEVLGWSWGMGGNASATISAGGRQRGASQFTAKEFLIVKRIDRASTSLMSVLRNNEPLRSATLSVRRAGGANPVEYLKITLERAHVRTIDIATGYGGASDVIAEHVSLSFQKVSVQYRSQEGSGGSGGSSEFLTELDSA